MYLWNYIATIILGIALSVGNGLSAGGPSDQYRNKQWLMKDVSFSGGHHLPRVKRQAAVDTLTEANKEYILNWHNEYRMTVTPQASNMNILVSLEKRGM